ncbi:hypothetical protein ABPG74_017099 [Tetrahymena malaccensis]
MLGDGLLWQKLKKYPTQITFQSLIPQQIYQQVSTHSIKNQLTLQFQIEKANKFINNQTQITFNFMFNKTNQLINIFMYLIIIVNQENIFQSSPIQQKIIYNIISIHVICIFKTKLNFNYLT